MSSIIAQHGLKTSYLLPADYCTTFFGCVGSFWERGNGEWFSTEQDAVSTTTAIMAHNSVCRGWSGGDGTSRVVSYRSRLDTDAPAHAMHPHTATVGLTPMTMTPAPGAAGMHHHHHHQPRRAAAGNQVPATPATLRAADDGATRVAQRTRTRPAPVAL
eukprot:NODE_7800_length_576_cov_31.311804_g7777_i0.p2 GENE.NODE_7800_length_576_cov_31.311804_g7777_i0~~NODE_7800_length_576_cov_31.311804_g7777_i0.p2  ORF type:complete len:173 (+),score=22.45 NODE_7800_length_576_cov_31.311804_g7777_i0:44-520(+)